MIRYVCDGKKGRFNVRMDGKIGDIMEEAVSAVGIVWASMPEEVRPVFKNIIMRQFSEKGSIWTITDDPQAMQGVEAIRKRHCLLDGSAAEISPLGKKIAEALSRKEGER